MEQDPLGDRWETGGRQAHVAGLTLVGEGHLIRGAEEKARSVWKQGCV